MPNKVAKTDDREEIIKAIREMGRHFYGEGYGPQFSDWRKYRQEGMPGTRVVYRVITGCKTTKRDVNAGEWLEILSSIGLRYPPKMTNIKSENRQKWISKQPKEEMPTFQFAAHGRLPSESRNPDHINIDAWELRTFYDWRKRREVTLMVAMCW